MKVVLYKTENCPICKMLKEKLNSKGIEFEEFTDVEAMLQMGISSVPVLEVDGERMTTGAANAWIRNQ